VSSLQRLSPKGHLSEKISTKKLESATAPVNPQFHNEFEALVALYYSGEISEEEWALLQIHMAYCDSCHDKFLQYQQIASDVIPAMAAVAAADFDNVPEESLSSLNAAEQRLMSRLDSLPPHQETPHKRKFPWRVPAAILAASAAAVACLVGIHSIHGKNGFATQGAPQILVQPASRTGTVASPATDTRQFLEHSQDEIASLQKQLLASDDRLKQTTLAMVDIEKQLQSEQAALKQADEERDNVSAQLTAAQIEAASLRNKFVVASTDTTQQATQVAVLETRIRELNAALDERNVQLGEKTQLLDLDKEFLDHDKDIRDVIGARNLYIADISDLTQDGRTAKQFGRIFYTKDRSLLFYGFDLDSQANHKQDVSFQVWGSGSDRSAPVNLGLFYQDDTHKRWVLRCNDAKTLARLDMVFVTVEPPGGSAKPTGKQLLRAYLQIQPNHP
jgi:Anti-sigma-K factor rskA